MQRALGTAQPPTEPADKDEVRWIERLQQRPLPAPIAPDSPDGELWIRRLQQRAGNRTL
ncbi:hypothetical protein [Dongia sp. agr-C8]